MINRVFSKALHRETVEGCTARNSGGIPLWAAVRAGEPPWDRVFMVDSGYMSASGSVGFTH